MKKLTILAISMTIALVACKKMDDFQVDPNRTTQATPDLLLTTVERLAFNEVDAAAAFASRQLVYTDGINSNQYYGWQRGSFNDYSNLLQVVRMEQEAARVNKPVYAALAKFFRAYFGIRLTMRFGDVPFSEALKGGEGKYTAVYDTQQSVFLQSLDLLKEANQELASTTEIIQGDIVYQGDVMQWRKLINSFTLRVLMSLSKRVDDATINPDQRFVDIYNDRSTYPLFESNADNAQLTFFDIQSNRYPLFNNNDFQTAVYMDESFIDTLKFLKDPRLFKFATKAPKFSGAADDDFNAYGGLKGSAMISENTARAVAGEASRINSRYFLDPVNEPSVAMGYAELNFILAEAAMRNWINVDPGSYYKEGIRASMQFYGIESSKIDAYLLQPMVVFDEGRGLQQIIQQKYIGLFMNSGWNAFFEQRRTGFPAFDTDGGGVLNDGRIPKRWMYPESELQLNRSAVMDAIERQFGASDDVNGEMWLVK